jgi:hypothetical protein
MWNVAETLTSCFESFRDLMQFKRELKKKDNIRTDGTIVLLTEACIISLNLPDLFIH